jgi:hypothetical protein
MKDRSDNELCQFVVAVTPPFHKWTGFVEEACPARTY